MKRFVRVFKLGSDFEAREVGRIESDGSAISFAPADCPLLKFMAAEALTLPVGGKLRGVRANDPDLFLDSLHKHYSGSYLWCSRPEAAVSESAESREPDASNPRLTPVAEASARSMTRSRTSTSTKSSP